MKRYRASKNDTGTLDVVVEDGDKSYPLPLRLDLRNHSPSGFQAGYNGSGPAQLSLALLADALSNDETAQRFYQDFKNKVIARLEGDQFELSQEDIIQAVAQLAKARSR
jgi:hypothetical protein